MKRFFSLLIKSPKIAAILVTVLLLVVFNLTRRPLESEKTRGYDAWLKGVEEMAKIAGSDPAATPEITISLSSRADDASLNWKFSTIKGSEYQENNDRVLRLLELIRTSQVLEGSRSPGAELHLTVTEKEKTFVAYFERSDAARNVSLGNFLKLFQIYVTTVPGSAQKIN